MQDVERDVDGQLLTWDEITALVEELRSERVEVKESLLVQLLMTLIQQVRFDALTGLYNRRYLMECLAREVARAQRYDLPLSVLVLDLDHFKRINDTYGHLIGDTVLTTVSTLLRETIRGTDIPGRLGGEEFCIVLPATLPHHASLLAERLRQRVASEVFQLAADLAFSVTCSIGVALWTAGTRDGIAVLAHADSALYQAKDAGRNRIVVAR